MRKPLLALLWIVLASHPVEARPVPRINAEAPTSAYLNGLWYEVVDGKVRFVPGDRYSVAGVFTAEKPEGIERTIDLKSAYVIPPFGEAHGHNVEGPWTLPMAERHLSQGIFYYKNPNNIASAAAQARNRFNKPDALDVVFAHGGLSIGGGHPNQLYRGLARQYGLDPERLDGQAFFDVPTAAAVTKRWPEILRGRPDLIKLYLLDAAGQAGGKPSGLNEEALRRAIALAREAGLRTTVHLETAADLALAVAAGADEAAHLPGYTWADGLNGDAYRIDDKLARRMAEQGFVVVTTTLVTEGFTAETKAALDRRRQIQEVQAENLRRLAAAGVPLAIGTDIYSKTALDEAKHLRKLGVFTDAELLRIWVETGPRSIFPGRAIGGLTPGQEASFLVLEGDPSQDFGQVERIRLRVKQGAVLPDQIPQ